MKLFLGHPAADVVMGFEVTKSTLSSVDIFRSMTKKTKRNFKIRLV